MEAVTAVVKPVCVVIDQPGNVAQWHLIALCVCVARLSNDWQPVFWPNDSRDPIGSLESWPMAIVCEPNINY